MIRIPKDFAEDLSLFIQHRKKWYGWGDKDIEEFKAYIRRSWESEYRQAVRSYVKEVADEQRGFEREVAAANLRLSGKAGSGMDTGGSDQTSNQHHI